MTDDLVKRLRDLVGQHIGDADIDDELSGAADRIEALDAEIKLVMEINERLLAALRKITKTAPFGQPQEIARAVLGENKND